MTSALTAALTPKPDALPAEMQELWLPEITDQKLRKAMWANPRLVERLRDEVYLLSGIDRQEDIPPFPGDEKAILLVTDDTSAILRKIGLAWSANRILATATAGTLRLTLPGITRDEVRQTVTYRALASDEQSAFDAPFDPVAEGLKCVSCWVRNLPKDVAYRLSVILGATLSDETPEEKTEARAALVDRLLTDLVTEDEVVS